MSTWAGEMTDTVTVAPPASVDKYQTPTAGAQAEVACKLFPNGSKTRGADGTEIDTKDLIISHTEIAEQSLVWLPGANTSNVDEAKTASSVREYSDLSGTDTVWEVTL